MHWAERIAASLIALHPERQEFHCASGATPSGAVHCGNLRDILTNFFVARCLVERGKRVRLIHSWDDYDRFRKVPKNVPPEYGLHLGKPLVDVPDPLAEYTSYAERYEKPFEQSLQVLGVDLQYRYQASMYRGKQYNYAVVEAVQHRTQIYDILASFRTQRGNPVEREAYYPIEIYCSACGRDTTHILTFDDSTLGFAYRCACGHEGGGTIDSATNLKLPWKIDWAMRWRHEDILFEPGGKDHGTAGGSYEVASRIAKEVFGRQPPTFQVYEFIGIKGLAGKMSGSSGNVITPDEALKVYQPEVLLWVFSRIAPNRAFDLVLDRQIFQIYDEYDHAAAIQAPEQPERDAADRKAVDLARVARRRVYPVPFRQLVGFSGIVRGNKAALAEIFLRLGTPFTEEQFAERLAMAENWLQTYAPEEEVRLVASRRTEYFGALPREQRQWILALAEWLCSAVVTLEAANEKLYAIPQAGQPDENRKHLHKIFFRDIYQLLFGRDNGPRLATFLAAVPKSDYLHLLDFSEHPVVNVFRAVWLRGAQLDAVLSKEPILPAGVETEQELQELRHCAERNFGTLRLAALHHLTGATGPSPNRAGKPVFTFWSRNREAAIRHALSNHPGIDGYTLVLIASALVEADGVVVAQDDGLYDEKISDSLPDTFSELRDEDEVLVAVPVRQYGVSVLEATAGSRALN